ncbi:MAG: YcgN family cysteine cluster protein [Rhodobacterales bacterium]|nr:YcgN family cysteine cluster protein [Rhodobacterales bacterium]
MSDTLRPRFWESYPLEKLNRAEWEAVCDGCGKCCLNKLEDEETGEVALTRVACRLLDDQSCRCAQYPNRHQFVPECIVLTPKTLVDNMYWLPLTCAYRLLYEGRPLYDWHPLVSGDPESVHDAGVSVRGMTIPEFAVDEDDWEDHIIEEPL